MVHSCPASTDFQRKCRPTKEHFAGIPRLKKCLPRLAYLGAKKTGTSGGSACLPRLAGGEPASLRSFSPGRKRNARGRGYNPAVILPWNFSDRLGITERILSGLARSVVR
jgi:hypothetical protein